LTESLALLEASSLVDNRDEEKLQDKMLSF